MFRRNNILLYSVVFVVGAAIIGASWAYGGGLIPQQRPDGVSVYDRAGFYVELAIRVATLISGMLLLAILVIARRD